MDKSYPYLEGHKLISWTYSISKLSYIGRNSQQNNWLTCKFFLSKTVFTKHIL